MTTGGGGLVVLVVRGMHCLLQVALQSLIWTSLLAHVVQGLHA